MLPMNTTVLIILLFIVIAVAVSQLGVILYFVNFIKKNQLHDGAIKDAQEKSASVIAAAVAKSNDLVAKAQEDQIEKVSEESKKLEDLAKQFEQTVNQLEQTTTSELTSTAKEATESLETVAESSEKTLQTLATDNQEALKNLVATDRKVLEEKTDSMINQSSQVFQQFMTQLSTQVREQLAGELDTAKKEIDMYKKERIGAINEKIIDILEETLVATLGKKLSLKDEGEFVFQALETAKKEHVFG